MKRIIFLFSSFFLLMVLAGCGAKPMPQAQAPLDNNKASSEQQAPVPGTEKSPAPAAVSAGSDQPQAKAFAKGNPYAVDVSPTQAYKNPFSN